MFWVLHFHCEVSSSQVRLMQKGQIPRVYNQTTCKQAPSHLHGYLHKEKSSHGQAKKSEKHTRIFVPIFYIRREHHSYNWNTVPQKSLKCQLAPCHTIVFQRSLLKIKLMPSVTSWPQLRWCSCLSKFPIRLFCTVILMAGVNLLVCPVPHCTTLVLRKHQQPHALIAA